MTRRATITTARAAETMTAPGKHNAGDNLYLVNDLKRTKAGHSLYRYWSLIYSHGGRRREMVLGSLMVLSLAEARRKALEARILLNDGVDPLQARAVSEGERPTIPTFGAFADEYVLAHRVKFRNDKHAAQWETTLSDRYCKHIRRMPVDAIDTGAILKVLEPLWTRIPETASRLRGRIENILDAARARGIFNGENPARWKGHLKSILPARQRLVRGHHAALPYPEMPDLMARLGSRYSRASSALQFCVLTTTRSGETLGARWDEIDMDRALWTIPARRMKAGYEHRVPLAQPALRLLAEVADGTQSGYIFPGRDLARPLSNMALAMQLRRAGAGHVTVHGFRSTFRDWASEQTGYAHETCEHALAHRISDKAEAAYRRGDQLDKRRDLMEAWARFCTSLSALV